MTNLYDDNWGKIPAFLFSCINGAYKQSVASVMRLGGAYPSRGESKGLWNCHVVLRYKNVRCLAQALPLPKLFADLHCLMYGLFLLDFGTLVGWAGISSKGNEVCYLWSVLRTKISFHWKDNIVQMLQTFFLAVCEELLCFVIIFLP